MAAASWSPVGAAGLVPKQRGGSEARPCQATLCLLGRTFSRWGITGLVPILDHLLAKEKRSAMIHTLGLSPCTRQDQDSLSKVEQVVLAAVWAKTPADSLTAFAHLCPHAARNNRCLFRCL